VQKSLMPKGVDHMRLTLQPLLGQQPVQKSLMPKGVDHWLPIDVIPPIGGAKIFDAERR